MTNAVASHPFHAVPLFGPLARVLQGVPAIAYLLVLLVAVLALAILHWGAVILTLAALVLVPVVFVLLIAIAIGK